MRVSNMRRAGLLFTSGLIMAVACVAQAQDGKTPRTAAPEPAQTPAQAPQVPAWIVTCSNANPAAELRCRIQQTLTVTQTRQRLVSINVERNPQGGIVGRIALPHGLLFAPGVQVWVGEGRKRPLPIVSGDESGSYADMPVNAEFLNELKAGSVLRIQAKTLSQDDLVMELTLNGFSSAIKFVERNPS